MFNTPRVLSFASTAVLALALSQGPALAQAPATAPVATPPAAPAATAPAAAEDPRARMDAMRAERRASCDKMMAMTPEERAAMRETHWKEMRARAAVRGVELPETPPWVAAEQRRKEAHEQFEKYRKTVEALTPEQLEAVRAMFGAGDPPMQDPDWSMPPMPPMPPQRPMRGGYGYGPQGGYPGYGPGPYQGGPGPMPMPYDEGAMEQAAPPAPAQP
ncbi:hypothetical protein [Candidatus Thiodictyon syntrophicum]|jgi:hypothetical protein|uniref:LTXXQ motif family protein n=1 Tax=Candidatus Thiodictyon syntrophicum TaxID=1166950 RepID=A0A2K8U2U6_9GAMM|nr:hypothetical protein [Candidatus Thiodictyon syntrophicum]AUB79908.1 hypothetical protein THSYN_02315 [Candidatus Thiodictyon syntrophicum]